MKTLILATVTLLSTFAHADISCKAIYRELWTTKPSFDESIDLKQSDLTPATVTLQGEIRGRTLVLQANFINGDCLLSQVWGKDFTNGVNTSGTFNSSGRLALSTISDIPSQNGGETGTAVYRVECARK